MNNILDITLIMPVINVITEEDKQLLGLAVHSVFNQKDKILPKKILFVTNTDTKTSVFDSFIVNESKITEVSEIDGVKIEFLINDDTSDNYQSQVNKGVTYCDTKYFMLLDFDDELNTIHLSNVKNHIELLPNFHMYLTLLVDTDMNKGVHRYINDICWAKDATGDNHGQLLFQVLLNYNLISINGAVISKEKFLEVGALKESFKLSFVYEFLLRFTHNDGLGYTIPKIGYIRKNGRENSYLHKLSTTLSNDEVKYWWELAKIEYVWPFDRNKKYIPKDTLVV